jgi:glutamyl-tRNA synthetase
MLKDVPFNKNLSTRIAPTPSGYLHLGNVYHLLLTKLFKNLSDGSLHLRIDDHDHERFRLEYVEDIFEQLDWLEMTWTSGPATVNDFTKSYRQMDKLEYYRSLFFQFQLESQEKLYVCACSRTQLQNASINPCREQKLIYTKNETTIRYFNDQLKLDGVIWRKDDLPSYHWVSLCEDIEHKINFIIRGEDLLESTHLQLAIAQDFTQFKNFTKCQFYHHSLIKNENGEKLSKSQKASSIKMARESGLSRDYLYSQFSQWLGMNPSSDWQRIEDQFQLKLSTLSII